MKTIPERISEATECRFCLDPINPQARICKACGEPQGLFRRGRRFVSAVLSLLVALGSLGIAFLQYSGAQVARSYERAARSDAVEARVEAVAAGAAVARIVTAFDPDTRAQLRGTLLPTLDAESTLERDLQERPKDVRLRRDLLLQEALIPRANTQQ